MALEFFPESRLVVESSDELARFCDSAGGNPSRSFLLWRSVWARFDQSRGTRSPAARSASASAIAATVSLSARMLSVSISDSYSSCPTITAAGRPCFGDWGSAAARLREQRSGGSLADNAREPTNVQAGLLLGHSQGVTACAAMKSDAAARACYRDVVSRCRSRYVGPAAFLEQNSVAVHAVDQQIRPALQLQLVGPINGELDWERSQCPRFPLAFDVTNARTRSELVPRLSPCRRTGRLVLPAKTTPACVGALQPRATGRRCPPVRP